MNYLTHDVVLVPFPFSDLASAKVRPAIVISTSHPSQDLLLIALTSRVQGLQPGEFVLKDWKMAGMNVPTSVKRNLGTIKSSLIVKKVGHLANGDKVALINALQSWLSLELPKSQKN